MSSNPTDEDIPPELARELLRALLVGEGSVIARLLTAVSRPAKTDLELPASPTPAPALLVYTVSTLSEAIGMSRQYVLNDIRDGSLRAQRRDGGRKWTITIGEAERYAAWVGAGRPEPE